MRAKLTVAGLAAGAVLFAVAWAQAGGDPAAKCKAAKAKAAGQKAAALLKAFGKNISKNPDAKLVANISKAQSKFTKAFSKAESKGGCAVAGDAQQIEAEVDALVLQVLECDAPSCGNFLRGCSEACDAGPAGGPAPADCLGTGVCLPSCMCAECGDGIVVPFEQCDSGFANGTAESCCTLACTFQPVSTPCVDNDGETCAAVGCDGVGGCDQRQTLVPAGMPCPDMDGNPATIAGCDGFGECDQLYVVVTTTTMYGWRNDDKHDAVGHATSGAACASQGRRRRCN